MQNIIQHVIIDGNDEMVVLNGQIIMARGQESFSDEVECLKEALKCAVEVEEIEEPKDSDWKYDDILELIPNHETYLKKLNEEDDTIALLRNIIHDVNASGGLIEFTDGNCAPQADPSWIDLGSRIEEINVYLQGVGSAIRIKREKANCTSDEACEVF
jgi:hypothetical protein